jgi:hypothetical protein
MIRTMLARTLHLAPQAIEFVFNKYGKPALVGDCGVTFSLAHSGEHVICALAAPCGYVAAVAATGGVWATKVLRWRAQEFLPGR